MISADFLVITEINGKKLMSYSDYIDLQSEYVRETEKQKVEIKALRKQVEELEKQNTDIQNSHMKLYNDTKDEILGLKEIIRSLEEDNSKYASANSMYIVDLEECESSNEKLNKKIREMEEEIERLKEKCGEVPADTAKEASFTINKENATISLPYERFSAHCSEKAFEEIKKGHWTGVVIKTAEEIKNLPFGCKRTEDLLSELVSYEKMPSPRKITKEEDGVDFESLCKELQDQHQQDCIRINDLTTTINVLSGLYAKSAEECGDGLMEENKKVEDVINEREKQMFQGFAVMMDAIWRNDNGTKGLESFLKDDSSVLRKPKKKIPYGTHLHFEDGIAKIDFSCPDCGKYHENVWVGNPFKCECGCDIHTSPFTDPEEDD